MAAVADTSNHYKYVLLNAVSGHTFKAILMDTTFVFDRDAHATLANVTSDQISTGYGYTQDDKTLTGVSVTEDDANDRAQFTCDDVTWTASGDDIGPFGAMIIYDETDANNAVVGCIDFGTDYTIVDGASWTGQDIVLNLGIGS
jgi:hypothetical protein